MSLYATYFILKPLSKETSLVFLLLSAFLCWGVGRVWSAPMYPLLAYLGKTRQSFILPLLALVKEHALIIGILFLLLFDTERQKQTILFSLIAGMVYISVLSFMGPMPYSPLGPMFTPVRMLSRFLGGEWFPLETATIVISIILLAPYRSKEIALVTLNAIPVFLVGYWWEYKLWLPALIVLLAYRKGENKHGIEYSWV